MSIECSQAAKSLMNDLDLHITPPSGPTIYGNHFVDANGAAVLTPVDHLNPNEQVLIEEGQIPEAGGVYVVSVRAFSLVRAPQAPRDYALVVTGNAVDLGGNCDAYLSANTSPSDQGRGKAADMHALGYEALHEEARLHQSLESQAAASAFQQVGVE